MLNIQLDRAAVRCNACCTFLSNANNAIGIAALQRTAWRQYIHIYKPRCLLFSDTMLKVDINPRGPIPSQDVGV